MRARGLSGVASQVGYDENRGRGNEKNDEGKAQVASHGHLQRAIKRQSELVGRGGAGVRLSATAPVPYCIVSAWDFAASRARRTWSTSQAVAMSSKRHK